MSKNNSLSFHVSGMHCASCASNITRSLSKIDGVTSANVNYANEQASVEIDLSKKGIEQQVEKVVKKLGYQAYLDSDESEDIAQLNREKELKDLRLKIIISGFLASLLMLSMVPSLPSFMHHPVWVWILATPIQFWAGKRFYQGAISGLKSLTANMDTLVALGTSVAYFYSVFVILFATQLERIGIPTHVYFEASGAIITFILLGKFLEIRAKGQTSTAIKKLMGLAPKTAHKLINGEFVNTPLDQVEVGDILLIKPGEKIPVDGLVIQGESTIDESMITGESLPVFKKIDDQVIGASINSSGSIQIKAEKVGSETMLANIIKMVKEAQGSRPPIQKLVDQIASVFVPIVIVLSIITFLLWFAFGPDPKFIFALVSMINVLIIACPCALGLATPTSLIVGIGKGAQAGILIKDAQVLEVANKLKAVVFDKTGTLTEGKPKVQNFETNGDRDKVLQIVRSIESLSHHPLAQAVVNFIKLDKSANLKVKNFEDLMGKGVQAKVGNNQVLIGNQRLMTEMQVKEDRELSDFAENWKNKGQTVVFVSISSEVVAVFGIADTVRSNAVETIKKLKNLGITSIMLTGDNHKTAQVIAKSLGIEDFQAEVLPVDKKEILIKLQQKYSVVGMVGDGINDAPALASADVSMAMGQGTDVAMQTAGVTLLRSDISLVPTAISLSKATIINIRQNLFWAFAYNIILIPVAMGLLYPFWGVLLSPILAGAAMAFSSVTVVGNALRLKTIKI